MRVRMLRQISGTRNGKPWPEPGAIVDLPQDEAVMLCRLRMAEPVAETPAPETATAPKASTRGRRKAG